jgi:hypothetical protein
VDLFSGDAGGGEPEFKAPTVATIVEQRVSCSAFPRAGPPGLIVRLRPAC